jgi:predicted nucleic acid-binding protein
MILLDSSFLVAFHNTRDIHHEAAAGVMQLLLDGKWGSGLLLEYVFLEVTTVIALRRSPALAVSVGDILLEARELSFVPCSAVFRDASATFRSQGSAGLSFVDAAIVSVARRMEVPVATFDSGFRKLEGISAVPS